MGVTIEDYPMVERRSKELDCLPLTKIAILPENFDVATSSKDFRQRSEAGTVRTLFRKFGVQTDDILSTYRSPYIQNNSIEWVAPVLFIGAGVVSDNPSTVSVALGVMTNYLTDLFKGVSGGRRVKVEIVVERQGDRACKKISYDGDLSGLSALPDIIMRVSHE